MIKKIFLDWGGVLGEDNNLAAANKLASKFDVDEDELLNDLRVEELKFSSDKECDYYYAIISKLHGIPEEEIMCALNEVGAWENFNFVQKSLAKRYDLFLLSNQLQRRTDAIKKDNDLSFFEDVFFSSEIGLQKPNLDIFEFALSKVGCDACECLFVDDNVDNVESARLLGFNVILYKGLDDFKRELESLGVEY